MPTPPRIAAASAAAVLALAAALLPACGRTVITQRARTDYARSDPAAEMEFWYSLPGRAAVSNDEALHALVLLEGSGAEPRGFEARVAYAKARGWLPESWDEPAEQAVQRGTLARGLAQVCGIKGGVIMRVLGPIPRYALRELIFEGIMPPSTENQTISGLDFLGVISRAQDYIIIARQKQARRQQSSSQQTPAPTPSRNG